MSAKITPVLAVAILVLAAACLFSLRSGGQKEILLYCGAGIRPAADALIKAFEAGHDITINISYGGGGKQVGQIACTPFIFGDGHFKGPAHGDDTHHFRLFVQDVSCCRSCQNITGRQYLNNFPQGGQNPLDAGRCSLNHRAALEKGGAFFENLTRRVSQIETLDRNAVDFAEQ